MDHGLARRAFLLRSGAAAAAAAAAAMSPAIAHATGAPATSPGPPAALPGAAAATPQVAGHPWLPRSRRVGQGTLRVLGFAAYDAALFALPDFDGSAFAAHPFVLEIRYRRALTGAAIADYSLAQMSRGSAPGEAAAERWGQFMRRAFPDVQSGDRLTGLWLPASGVSRFAANDAAAVELQDGTFGPRFFGIWLAAQTPRPELRAQLLGLDGTGRAGTSEPTTMGPR